MRIRDHGGGCCGILHLSDFSGLTEEKLMGQIAIKISTVEATQKGRVIEAVVADFQLRAAPHILRALASFGFAFVSSFRNSNSGSICYVFHKHPNLTLGAPRKWTGLVGKPLPIVPAPIVQTPVIKGACVNPSEPMELTDGTPVTFSSVATGGQRIYVMYGERNDCDSGAIIWHDSKDGTFGGDETRPKLRNVNRVIKSLYTVDGSNRIFNSIDELRQAFPDGVILCRTDVLRDGSVTTDIMP